MSSQEKIRISRLTPADHVGVISILKASLSTSGTHWTEQQMLEELFVERVWGVWEEGQVHAFAIVRPHADGYEILHLATALASRRKGYMERLLAQILTLLSSGQEMWLEVLKTNEPARNLYEKLGFQEVGVRPHFYGVGQDAILYTYKKR